MKRLPLSFKVALWSFLMASLAMGGALFGANFVLRHELVSGIDATKIRLANEIFQALEQKAALVDRTVDTLSPLTRDMLPKSVGNNLIEIYGPGDELLYRAPALKTASLLSNDESPHDTTIRKQVFRVLTFQHKSLKLLIASPMETTLRTLARVNDASIVVVPVVALLSLFGGYWVASRALGPVRKLIDAANKIGAGDASQRLPLPAAQDDIRQLTNVLNDTFDRLERSYQQAVRFASDASHQLKTPITVMRSAIEALLRDPNIRPEHVTTLHDLLDQTRRLTSLSEGLLLLAKADAGSIQAKLGEVNLVPIIERCIEDAEVLGSNHDITIALDCPSALLAFADAERTEQILLNLLENAVKYNRRGGTVRVKAEVRTDGVYITVANTGDPIPEDRKKWVFHRFSRGARDESRAGHGLGLSIARELANAQGGDIHLVRSDELWTEFELKLRHPGARNTAALNAPDPKRTTGRILIGNPG